MCLVVLGFSFSKPKQFVTTQIQKNYTKALLEYEGTAYAPYGETGGISCSTLVRKALAETEGVDDNTRATIKSFPCSSDELKKGCHNQLSFLTKAIDLKDIDYARLQPGDVAIIGNEIGVHTMAYLGDGNWIHADPITEKVSVDNKDSIYDDWSKYKVSVMRWNIFKN